MIPQCEGRPKRNGYANRCRNDAVGLSPDGPRCFRCKISAVVEAARQEVARD